MAPAVKACSALLAAAFVFETGHVRAAETHPCAAPVSICEQGGAADFALIRNGQPVPVFVDGDADPAVRHVATSFAADLERVSGRRPDLIHDIAAAKEGAVVIGVLGGLVNNIFIPALFGKNARLIGISVGSREQFASMTKAMDGWKLKPVIDQTFAFDQVPDALRAMKAAGHFGKIGVKY